MKMRINQVGDYTIEEMNMILNAVTRYTDKLECDVHRESLGDKHVEQMLFHKAVELEAKIRFAISSRNINERPGTPRPRLDM